MYDVLIFKKNMEKELKLNQTCKKTKEKKQTQNKHDPYLPRPHVRRQSNLQELYHLF